MQRTLRFRIVRFVVLMILAVLPLTLLVPPLFQDGPREALPLYLSPQRGLLPDPKPSWAFVTPLPPEQAGELMLDFYRRKPAYTRAVLKAVGVTLTDENELRELGARLLLLAVKPERA